MAKQSALKVPTGLSPEKQAKVDAILKKYEEQNRQIEREHAKEMAKLYGGAALQVGSAFIPGTLGLKLAGGAIKGLTPIVGRKIAQNVATGVTSGLASGAVEGLGRGLMENQNPLKTMATDSLAGGLLGGLGGYGLGKVAQKLNTQTAWHGSPYKFDKFDNAYIGTGEGAQAHGYGHYSAKSKDVADKRYRERLVEDTFDNVEIYSKEFDETVKEPFDVAQYLFGVKNNPEEYQKALNRAQKRQNEILESLEYSKKMQEQDPYNYIPNTEYNNKLRDDLGRINTALMYLEDIDNFDIKFNYKNPGQLYKLSIPKDDVMLREDLPFSEQPLKVQEAIRQIASEKEHDIWDYNKLIPKYNLGNNLEQNTGREIYNSLTSQLGKKDFKVGANKAADLLNQHGIKGISYNGGIDGEANVIFNPDDIDIIPYYDNPTSFKEKFINLLNR